MSIAGSARGSSPVDVSFVSSGHDIADARLHRLVRACRSHGLTVEVLALGAEGDAPEGALARTWDRPSMLARAPLALRLALRATGRVLVAPDPDSLLACWTVTRRPGSRRRLVADVHENYADLLRDRSWATGTLGAAGRLVARSAARLAENADLTLVADDHVEPGRARQRLVVRNEPDLALLGTVQPLDARPRAVYVGDTRTSRGLFDMLDALAATSEWTLDIVGEVAAADRGRLDLELTRPELRDRVRVHGRRPPHQAWDIARGAWVGLALLHDTPAFREALPSKLYEYLALGITPVVSDLPRQRELLAEVGSGFVVPGAGRGLAERVATTLEAVADDPTSLDAHRDAALAWRARTASAPSGYDRVAERIEGLLREA